MRYSIRDINFVTCSFYTSKVCKIYFDIFDIVLVTHTFTCAVLFFHFFHVVQPNTPSKGELPSCFIALMFGTGPCTLCNLCLSRGMERKRKLTAGGAEKEQQKKKSVLADAAKCQCINTFVLVTCCL